MPVTVIRARSPGMTATVVLEVERSDPAPRRIELARGLTDCSSTPETTRRLVTFRCGQLGDLGGVCPKSELDQHEQYQHQYRNDKHRFNS